MTHLRDLTIAAPSRSHGAWQRAAVGPGGVHHLPQVPLAPAAKPYYPAPAGVTRRDWWNTFTVTAAIWAVVLGAGVLVWLVGS